ncbi:MAG: hypothetical protein NT141_02420 [candidate division WWE3 bacterium]|nr:hypothetical protein [candidate division WWE3 bacterium]
MENPIPATVLKYFWGDNTQNLSLLDNKKYIVQTLLEKGDTPDIKWLFSEVGEPQIKALLPDLKLSVKSANFWKIFFEAKT